MTFKSTDQKALRAIYECFSGDETANVVIELEPVGEVEPVEGQEEEHNEVLYSDVKKLADYAVKLLDVVKNKKLEDWMVSDLTIASSNISKIYHRLDSAVDFANAGGASCEDSHEHQEIEYF